MKRSGLLRNDALTDPHFWAMHYYMLIGTHEVDETEFIEPFFGVSNKAVNDYFLREFDAGDLQAGWPYLEAPVRAGFSVQVEYAGAPDSETRFYVNHKEWPLPICLGYQSGHFALPAFRWCEIEAIERAGSGIDGALALLPLFPAVWVVMEEDRNRIRSVLVEAWVRLGVANPKRLEEMVDQTIDHCTAEVDWWKDLQLGWINAGRYSFRNPKTLMCAFEPDRFVKVAAFFAGIGAGS